MPAAPCSATTASGQPCRFPARKLSGVCVNHDPAYREQRIRTQRAATDASAQSRRRQAELRANSSLYSLDSWALADRSSIQALLDAVVRLELAGRLPNTRARNLLRALAIAVRNFDPPARNAAHERTARHNLSRYHHTRATLDQHLEALCAEADTRDSERLNPSSPPAPAGRRGRT